MRKFSRLTIIVMAMTVIMAILAGCGKTDSTSSAATRTLTYKDQTYTVPAKPERIAVLANSLLYFMDAIDAKIHQPRRNAG